MSSFDQSALWNIGSEIIGVVGQPKQWKSYSEFQPFRAGDFTTRFNLLKGFIKRNEAWILKKYSWLPNKRTVWNKSSGQEILQKIINAHDEIIAQGKKLSKNLMNTQDSLIAIAFHNWTSMSLACQ